MIGRRGERRYLATILFTDIAGSTDLAARIGDQEWRKVVAAHNAMVRRWLHHYRGREIDTAGDGFLASFEQPAQAVRAADAIVRDAACLGLTVRAGVHTGECEIIGRKVGGIAVHIAARVMALAEGGEVLVSSTVHDVVAGSHLEFADHGAHALKGVPGEWHVYSLVREDARPVPDNVAVARADATPEGASARRQQRAASIAGIVAAVLAVGLAYLAFWLDATAGPVRPIVNPGPDTVVALDSSSGVIVGNQVRGVDTGPVAIEVSDGSVWVAALDAGVVTGYRIDGEGSDQTTGRVGQPTDLAIGNRLIWVTDSFGQTLTMIDAATGDPVRTVEDVLLRRIAFGFNSAWGTDDLTDRVLRLDPQSGEVAVAIDAGSGTYPTAISGGPDAIWVGNAGTSTLTRIDPVDNSIASAAIPLRSVPYEVAAGGRDVWVAARAADRLIRIDPATNAVTLTLEVCDEPSALAVDGESVWLACADAVRHLSRDGTVLSETAVGGVPTDLALAGDRVFVTVRAR